MISTISTLIVGADESFNNLAALVAENYRLLLHPESVEMRAEIEGALVDRVQKHRTACGRTPEEADNLASLYFAVLLGIAIEAGNGGSNDRLLKIARTAATMWPM